MRTLPKNTSGVVGLHACAAQPSVPALKRRNNRNQVGFGGVRRVPAALAGACAAAAISISTEPALTLATARLPRWLCQNRDTPHLELSGARGCAQPVAAAAAVSLESPTTVEMIFASFLSFLFLLLESCKNSKRKR